MNVQAKKYIPIDCSYHDMIIECIVFKKRLTLVYDNHGSPQTIKTTLLDVFTKNGEEFIKLDSGALIRLDYIISIDGNLRPEAPNCELK